MEVEGQSICISYTNIIGSRGFSFFMYLYDVAWRKSLLQKRFVCELYAEVKGITV